MPPSNRITWSAEPVVHPDTWLDVDGKAVADAGWGAEAVRKAVQDVQSVITAAIVAFGVAATSAAG